MYGAPFSSVPTSETRHTCSLRSCADARASRRNRSTTVPCAISGRRNLSATWVPRCRCVAASTTPIPPSPSMLVDAVLSREDGPRREHLLDRKPSGPAAQRRKPS